MKVNKKRCILLVTIYALWLILTGCGPGEIVTIPVVPTNTPTPKVPSSLHWVSQTKQDRILDGKSVEAYKKIVITAKVDSAWKGKTVKFGVYEEDFGFWNKDEKITELEGNVKSDGTVITSQTWEASIQPGETGNQSEYYIKYIKYEITPGEYQVIKINDSPMLYVPHKTLVVGIAREETRKEYGIDFNLGADAISGTPTLKNVCDAKAKGTFCFKNKSHTVKIFMLPGPIAKSDPLVRISIVYPDRLHPKPDDWHFIFEPYNGNFEDCGEDTCTVWLPEWHPEGDGDELEPVMLDLRIESHDDGGFVPFLIRAEIVEPKPETPIVVMTPVYAIIAEGQNFILSEEFFEPPQIQPELFASETQQCIAGAILGEHSDIGSWLDFLSLFFIEQLGHEI